MSAVGQERQPLAPGSTGPIPTVVPAARRWAPRFEGRWITKLLLILVLIGLAILFLYPFEWLIAAAFKPRGETFVARCLCSPAIHWRTFAYVIQKTDRRAGRKRGAPGRLSSVPDR